LSDDELTLQNDMVVLRFDQDLSAIRSAKLKKFRDKKAENQAVELINGGPFSIQGSLDPNQKLPLRGFSARREGNSLIFTSRREGWLVVQTVSLHEKDYGFDVNLTFNNESTKAADLS